MTETYETVEAVTGQSLHAHAKVGEAKTLPLAHIYESPFNPRQLFPEAELETLAASMRADGFWEWTPLLVWPRGESESDGVEIGAGHRRFRAALRAELKDVPVIIRYGLTDEQKLSILNFENGNREPVNPLHEAEGWKLFMARTGKTVADVAAKAGYKTGYVYKRLKITEMIESVREAYLAGELSLSHAELIARCSPDDQPLALKACQPPSWDPTKVVSTRELQEWIHKNLQLDISHAPFSLTDAELLPVAGSCEACPHRVGNLPDFDPANDLPQVCGAPECYHRKIDAHIEAEKVRLQKENGYLVLISDNGRSAIPGVTPTDEWHDVPWLAEDPAAKYALVVEGRRKGRVVRVVIQERLALPTSAPVKPKPAPAVPGISKAERDKQNAEAQKQHARQLREAANQKRQREEAEANLRKEEHARLAILGAILPKVTWPPAPESVCNMLPDFLSDISEALDPLILQCGVSHPVTANRVDLERLSDDKLAGLCLITQVKDDFEDFNLGRKSTALEALAKRYAVDAGQVRARAAHELAIEECVIDFSKNVIECVSESKKNKQPLADIKFTAKPGAWFVTGCISLPARDGGGFGYGGPVCDGTSNERGIWKDRGAAIDEAFSSMAKFLATVPAYGGSNEATHAAAEEVRAWVTAGQAARAAIVALEEKPKSVKDVIGKLPVMGSPEAGSKKAAAPPAKAAPAPTKKATAQPAKKATSKAPAKKAPVKKGGKK